ncbi:alpha/beta fold hydrolase [Streptomyces sp. NPDC055078]
MRPKVIYVHGNGNKVRAELLKSQWDKALFGKDMADVSRMAYWAPILHKVPLPDFRTDPLDAHAGDAGPDDRGGSGPDAAEGRAAPREWVTSENSGFPATSEMPESPEDPESPESPEDFVTRTLAEARAGIGGMVREGRAAPGEPKVPGSPGSPGAPGGPGESEGPAVGPGEPGVPGGTQEMGALGDWLRDMTYLADTLAESERAAPETGVPPEALPLPRPMRKAVFRLLVKHTFKDVHAYFFGSAGPAMREVVGRALDDVDGPRVAVIGHSLGSVIAYEVLAERGQEVELFLTVGSPLAITEVKEQLASPPAVPAGVRAWHNASDLRDLVALDHTLRPDYRPVERITEILVANSSDNHHGISEYLRNRQVRAPLRHLVGDLAEAQAG